MVLFLIGSLIVGFAIHFLWVNRNGGEEALKLLLNEKVKDADQWRLKYYDLEELKEKQAAALTQTIKSLEEKEENLAIEIEELSLLNQQLLLKIKRNSAEPQKENSISQQETSKDSLSEDSKNFRQELQKLAQKYNLLEGELNRLQERI